MHVRHNVRASPYVLLYKSQMLSTPSPAAAQIAWDRLCRDLIFICTLPYDCKGTNLFTRSTVASFADNGEIPPVVVTSAV